MSAEVLRWYLEAAFLVALAFALGAGVMAVVLRSLLPAPAETETEPEGATYTVGTST